MNSSQRSDVLPALGDVVKDRYQVTRRIGAGSFGAIFEVQDLQDGKIIALKYEKLTSNSLQLKNEYTVYMILDAPVGIPRVYDFWPEEETRVMVMDRLGVSLGTYFRRCGKRLSLKTTLMIGIQMISRLEYMHQRSFIHRDIKPDNFVFGVGTNSNLLYLIDFGLSQKYRDLKTLIHKEYREDQGLVGTTRYVSINVHLGVEQSCRDDLESVGYVLIYLALGSLPWQEMEDASKNQTDLIKQSKMDTPVEVLCQSLPTEFLHYMQRVKALRFDERPPYAYLRNLFISLMAKRGWAFDYQYDWVIDRIKRLNDALQGKEADREQIIPIPDFELQTALKPDSKISGFFQPLPFFSIAFEAATFIGHSKRGRDIRPQKRPFLSESSICKEQTMFVLDKDRTKLPPVEIDCEFEAF